MIWDCTEKLRNLIDSNWPLPFDKWPEELREKTNCLAFALGLNIGDCDFGNLVYSNPEIPTPTFSKIFERLLNELGLEWRRIDSVEQSSSDEYVIQIYGFYPVRRLFYTFMDFHVIRRELDGSWVHKPDFKELPSPIDWVDFRKEYPDNEIEGIFAVRKPR